MYLFLKLEAFSNKQLKCLLHDWLWKKDNGRMEPTTIWDKALRKKKKTEDQNY